MRNLVILTVLISVWFDAGAKNAQHQKIDPMLEANILQLTKNLVLEVSRKSSFYSNSLFLHLSLSNAIRLVASVRTQKSDELLADIAGFYIGSMTGMELDEYYFKRKEVFVPLLGRLTLVGDTMVERIRFRCNPATHECSEQSASLIQEEILGWTEGHLVHFSGYYKKSDLQGHYNELIGLIKKEDRYRYEHLIPHVEDSPSAYDKVFDNGEAQKCHVDLGVLEHQRGNLAGAERLYRKACERGLHVEGRGAWVEEIPIPRGCGYPHAPLLDEGVAKGCYYLARFEDGRGNSGGAARLYKRACYEGLAQGCYDAGALKRSKGIIRYREVRGKSENLFRQACHGGYARACYELGEIRSKNDGTGCSKIAECYNSREHWYGKACDGGYLDGCAVLGRIANGKGDWARAVLFLQKVCDGEGRMFECNLLGELEEKRGNIVNAIKAYQGACWNGNGRRDSCDKARQLIRMGKGGGGNP